VTGDKAIAKGYTGVVGDRTVPYWEDSEHLYALWPGYVIPKQYQTILVRHLSPHVGPLRTEMGEIWLRSTEDQILIEWCLPNLQLRLEEWSASKDWVSTVASVMSKSYSEYLKEKDNISIFRSTVYRRTWEEFEDEVLRKLFINLSMSEYKGNKQLRVYCNLPVKSYQSL